MKLIVGLGNVGKEYVGTRHNIGFMVADEVARRWGESSWRGADNATYIEHRAPEKVYLIKPTTFMNLSGIAVADFVNFYHIAPEDVLVIQDDLDLPCGFVRIRRKGSSGGHNGIKSITQNLGTDEFPRIKIGIGHPAHNEEEVVKHVLQQFSTFEQEAVKAGVDSAASAVEMWLTTGDINQMAQTYNSKKAKKQKGKKEE
jgi:PTH1 family peptidyl-tRNA hydrolase